MLDFYELSQYETFDGIVYIVDFIYRIVHLDTSLNNNSSPTQQV